MSIRELINSIKADFESKKFDKFIHEINFPKFKNFMPGAKICFRFPISVIVGPNGGGKSSILHAMWGMPQGYSTSRFWFSTPVDPIESTRGEQNRYWYTHYIKSVDRVVQCRKISGNKRNGYWEPSRPNQSEGMDKMPPTSASLSSFMSNSADRWNQVNRVPTYINSKAESSAFERFFYYTSIDSLEEKQDYFLKYSKKLRHVIDYNLSNLSYYSIQRVFDNFVIPDNALKEINNILKKDYQSARYIVHDLYGKIKSSSVVFETSKRNYSECFAGSGELAIVNTILTLERLGKYDLLLLDEPETSLHPGAQKRFLEYLLRVVKDKNIQVLISTHSPTFVELLPEESLIVLDDLVDGVRARMEPTKSGAFHRLGQPASNKTLLLAEDSLLAAFVDSAHHKLAKEIYSITDVEAATVGASEMLSNQVKAYSLANSKVIMILDGDQSKVGEIFKKDFSALSKNDRVELVKQLARLNIGLSGGEESLETWASWCKNHVVFIDQICAEQLLLMCLNPSHNLLKNVSQATNRKFKSAVREEMHKRNLDTDPKSIAATFKTLLYSSAENSPQMSALNSLISKISLAVQNINK